MGGRGGLYYRVKVEGSGRSKYVRKEDSGPKKDISTTVTTYAGTEIDLSEFPLEYGERDPAVFGMTRDTVDRWEAKRAKAKIEYGLCIAPTGLIISETKGGKGSVKVSLLDKAKASVFTHIHPRTGSEDGGLGGTFSDADIQNFVFSTKVSSLSLGRMRTYRAVALEGVYSISRGAGFDGDGLLRYYRAEDRKLHAQYDAATSQAVKDYAAKKITWAEVERINTREFNRYLVGAHNVLLAGQSTYGYHYTLERR